MWTTLSDVTVSKVTLEYATHGANEGQQIHWKETS